jgi:hypothetical protein
MKKFNDLCREALFITSMKPDSDTASPAGQSQCPCQAQDGFSKTVDDFMSQNNMVQPTDDTGETGEIEGDSQDDTSNVELECTGDGLRVKFNGVEIVLPADVVQKIKDHSDSEETETPEEETEEQSDSDSETEDTETENESETETDDEDNEDKSKKDDAPF